MTGLPPLHAEEHRIVAPPPQGVPRGAALADAQICPDMGACRAHVAAIAPWDVRLYRHVRRAFAAFDTNRSGYLDYRELRDALRAYGLDATARGAARILAAYDRNPDGKMDLYEFARLISDLDAGQVPPTHPPLEPQTLDGSLPNPSPQP